MFCSKCGSKIEEEAKFCAKCGNPLTRVVTEDVSIGNHEKPDVGSFQMGNLQSVPPSPVSQYVKPVRDNLLIAIITLSAFTILFFSLSIISFSSGIIHYDLNPIRWVFSRNFTINCFNWLGGTIAGLALVRGFTYRLNFLKIISFIALALRWDFFEIILSYTNTRQVQFLFLPNRSGSNDILMLLLIIYIVLFYFFVIIFLVSAIQLLIKNTRNRK